MIRAGKRGAGQDAIRRNGRGQWTAAGSCPQEKSEVAQIRSVRCAGSRKGMWAGSSVKYAAEVQVSVVQSIESQKLQVNYAVLSEIRRRNAIGHASGSLNFDSADQD